MNTLFCGLRGPARQLAYGQIRTLSTLRPNVLRLSRPVTLFPRVSQRQFSLRSYLPKFLTELRSGPSLSPQQIANVANAEAEANANPQDLAKNTALFLALDATNEKPGRDIIIARWERLCEFDSTSQLIKSDDLFRIYLTALQQSGATDSINPAVRRRESLLAAIEDIPVPVTAAVTPMAAATGAAVEPTPVSAAPSTTTTTAAAEPATETSELSSSAKIAASVLSSPAVRTPQATDAAAGEPSSLAASALGGGTESQPLYVIIGEPKGSWILKTLRYVATAVLVFAFAMVVLAVLLENSGIMKGNKKANYVPAEGKEVKFSDVHGVDEVKEELRDIVEFLKDPTAFASLGGKLPKGCLLTGPPGTGKTLLARAIAGEAGVPFFVASASEFEEMFIGVGAKRVRELFVAARKQQPAIIFIDELDAVGAKRTGRESYARQTLNQLLTEMDGFTQSDGLVVIAATNLPNSLDAALTRPGRFDRTVAVPLPDIRGRVQILQHYMKEITADAEVDAMVLARGTPGFSGADLQNLINQAAIQASKLHADKVTLAHIEWAKDRIRMGSERKSMFVDEKEKLMTAYHEGGHTLVALYTAGAMPLHKVTCMPRGHSLGMTSMLPEADKHSMTFQEFKASIDVAFGGRIAEEMIYGKEMITSGASSDIHNATNVAQAMVRLYGFSDVVGPVYYGDDAVSPGKVLEIETAITKFVREGEARAKALLTEKVDELHLLAKALVEHETLDADEVRKVIKGEPIRKIVDILKEAKEEVLAAAPIPAGTIPPLLASPESPPSPTPEPAPPLPPAPST